jgi:hypothetical protein
VSSTEGLALFSLMSACNHSCDPNTEARSVALGLAWCWIGLGGWELTRLQHVSCQVPHLPDALAGPGGAPGPGRGRGAPYLLHPARQEGESNTTRLMTINFGTMTHSSSVRHQVRTRRLLLQRSFLFTCDCTKCHTEAAEDTRPPL